MMILEFLEPIGICSIVVGSDANKNHHQMNNLVDYGPDSDEESPRRRSSEGQGTSHKFKEEHERLVEEKRKRRNSDAYGDSDEDVDMDFVEPPPPKRVDSRSPSPAAFRTPKLGIPQTTSTASLVSYSGDGDDDEDSFIEAPKIPGSTPASELYEPPPPARQSRDDMDEDEEQKLIDRAIREGNEAMIRMNQEDGGSGSPMDTPGHDSVVDSPLSGENEEGTPPNPQADLPGNQEIRIPPPPAGEVNPRLQQVFVNAFEQKARGADLNKQIQGNPKYNNPMIYTTFIETFNIDEKGTNFAKNIFDPHVFPENCFYDVIGDEQRKLQEPPKKK
ncbi:unnamed protein product [Caenorhabditis brenneri]